MKTKRLFAFFTILLLFSCTDNHFRRFDLLPEDRRWFASDEKVYEFEIENDTQLYDLVFQFSHIYGYQFETIPLTVIIENPNGKTEVIDIDLNLKDSSGKELADCSGDVCDLYHKIKENTKLPKGNYKITISHGFKGPYLPNVIGVGFAVVTIK